ncbi:MAG: alpha/beta hydrolase [Treponema sp.]|nr:alpha/beta hydrolase [Treponema sp.]
MKVDRKAAIKKLKTLVLFPKSEVEPFREKLESTFSTIFLPNHVEKRECSYGGVKCDLLMPEVCSSRRVMLYVHGGSFVGGSRNSWRNFCASVAHASSCRVVVPEFRLAPSHPFPASIEDLETVFHAVHEEEMQEAKSSYTTPRLSASYAQHNDSVQIIIAADGSGASLAMALLFKLNETERATVTNLVLFSPWLDLSSDTPLIAKRHVADEVLSGDAMHRAVDLYTYASNIDNPLVSPLKAPSQDFKGFPEVYVQMGEKEILRAQVLELVSKLREANVPYILDIWPGMVYLFQMADEFLAESHMAVERMGTYIKQRRNDAENKSEHAERAKILKRNNISTELPQANPKLKDM